MSLFLNLKQEKESSLNMLMWMIILSILTVILESVSSFREQYLTYLYFLEWFFTFVFTIEFFCRIICVRKPLAYIFSVMGIVDILAILPAYISLFISGAQSLLIIRAIRLLRVFRILKLTRFISEEQVLVKALLASRVKITVFLGTVIAVVLIMGTIMYLVEGESNGFHSIPHSMYWAVVTLTTVGYGDMAPVTPLGRAIASVVMIMGYAIIAVPTGIVSVELASVNNPTNTVTCENCALEGHVNDAVYCRRCGFKLNSWVERVRVMLNYLILTNFFLLVLIANKCLWS